MIQVIAVHCGGTLPVAMELPTSGLNFVQQHALKFLPRSPAGVPELRTLGKGDGPVQFRFKVHADKISVECLPELLTEWDAKFTEATLKRIAKTNADERKAASAAGLWKGDGDKTDLTAMHGQCNPDEAQNFSEALATVVQKKVRISTGVKRNPKPKVLQSVIEASTVTNSVTGEQTAVASASERAVSTLRAMEIVKLMTGAGQGTENLVDPLENARLQDEIASPVAALSPVTPVDVLPDAAGSAAGVPPWDDGFAPDFSREPAGASYMSGALEVLDVLQAHKEGKSAGPRLIEMGIEELKQRARGGAAGGDEGKGQGDVSGRPADAPNLLVPLPLVDAGASGVAVAAIKGSADSTNEQFPSENRFAVDGSVSSSLPNAADQAVNKAVGQASHDAFDLFEGYGEPVFSAKQEPVPVAGPLPAPAILDTPVRDGSISVAPSEALQLSSVQRRSAVDWSGMCSFRLASSATNGHSVVLESGEVFEALAHLEIVEPLAVNARWFLDACEEDGVLVEGAERLAAQTGWLNEQLQWRNKQLLRWLGKADLVSPVAVVKSGEKPKKAKRPAGWADTGVALASLAQQISMDIAMLDMTIVDIERSITGMPSWAIDMMELTRSFSKSEADAEVVPEAASPGAAFRDAWRAELLRIDRWCAVFKPIKIARQFGLFGSPADQKLLLRLEDMIARARTWSAAPAQASRVLAVWLGFVLSLDHTAVALCGQLYPVERDATHEDQEGLLFSVGNARAGLVHCAGEVVHG
jgi:hypothetical protein